MWIVSTSKDWRDAYAFPSGVAGIRAHYFCIKTFTNFVRMQTEQYV